MVTAYVARQMTGRKWSSLYIEASTDKAVLAARGIHVLDPVLEEVAQMGILPEGCCGANGLDYETIRTFWQRDKQMIRQANVLIDRSPGEKSEGVAHEIGYARYHLWKPVIRVYDLASINKVPLIASFEDDVIATSLTDAAVVIREKWGTWGRRFKWRVALYWRCALKAYWFKLREWVR